MLVSYQLQNNLGSLWGLVTDITVASRVCRQCTFFVMQWSFTVSCFALQLSPYLCFRLHLSASLLLQLHRSLLIPGSDFLLLVTLSLSATHSQSPRTGFLARGTAGLPYLPVSTPLLETVSKCFPSSSFSSSFADFGKSYFSLLLVNYQDLESKQSQSVKH